LNVIVVFDHVVFYGVNIQTFIHYFCIYFVESIIDIHSASNYCFKIVLQPNGALGISKHNYMVFLLAMTLFYKKNYFSCPTRRKH